MLKGSYAGRRHYNESALYCLRPALPLRRGLLRPGILVQNAFPETSTLEDCISGGRVLVQNRLPASRLLSISL